MRVWYFLFILLVGCGGNDGNSNNNEVEQLPAPQQKTKSNGKQVSIQAPSIKEPLTKTPLPKADVASKPEQKVEHHSATITTPEVLLAPKLQKQLHIDGISISPLNYAAEQALKVIVSVAEHISDNSKTHCKWMIDDHPVSDSCEYQLKANEHLQKISVTAWVDDQGKQSDEFNQSFLKTFPVNHFSNETGIITLFSDNTLREHHWNASLQNKVNARDLTSEDNSDIAAIYKNYRAFAAINKHGNFISWGDKGYAGNDDIAALVKHLDTKTAASSDHAFALVTNNGDAYVVGNLAHWGNQQLLLNKQFTEVYGSARGFAFETADNQVCIAALQQNAHEVAQSCTNIDAAVKQFLSSRFGKQFAVLTEKGDVYTWTVKNNVYYFDHVATDVKQLIATQDAFAALKDNGEVKVWGNPKHGGIFSYNYQTIKDYKLITTTHDIDIQSLRFVTLFATQGAFAGLTADGKVWTWGSVFAGGNIYSNKVNHLKELQGQDNPHFEPIVNVLATYHDFTAITKQGHRIVWRGIWDIRADTIDGIDQKYNVYDKDVFNGKSRIEGWFDSGKPIEVNSQIMTQANEGAFVQSTQNLDNDSFDLFAWGFTQDGADLDTSAFSHFLELSGKVAAIYSDNTGFSLHSNYGDVYFWNGFNENSSPRLFRLYPSQAAQKL